MVNSRLWVLLGLVSLCSVSQLQSQAPKKPGGCVDVATKASFASVGYDHIVTLKSACKVAMACKVSTSVNPETASVQLSPGGSESVVTWRGSPASEFTANVTCSPAAR